MNLAFYAPMKPPTHPVPSGDRAMARALVAALGHGGRFTVDLASTFQSRDGRGDPAAQAALIDAAAAELDTLLAGPRAAGWAAWVTYHNYYKAPDLLGPAAAQALRIPYLLVEATRARKRLSGPWSAFAHRAEAATDAAALVFYMTAQDAEALERDRPAHQTLIHLRPFLPRTELPAAAAPDAGPLRLLAVGMMRAGDKLASYRLIADALNDLTGRDWTLAIAGDGPARPEVEALMAPLGARVTFLGRCDADSLAHHYARSSAFLWPGVNEAFGMVYLEAQAHGLPIIAQDRPGVRDVLVPGRYPDPAEGAAGLARRIAALLDDPGLRRDMGASARRHIADTHLLPTAAKTLAEGLRRAGVDA